MNKPREFWVRQAVNYSEAVCLPFDPEILLPKLIHVREVIEQDEPIETCAQTEERVWRECMAFWCEYLPGKPVEVLQKCFEDEGKRKGYIK